MRTRIFRLSLAATLVVTLIAAVVVVLQQSGQFSRTQVVGYFANSNGIYAGDQVRILGVPVGKIDKIEPQGRRVKISFWYDSKFKVPADVKAVILAPSLVAVRAIQLTPAYAGGPVMVEHAVIPENRTAVPVEWDDLRQQLQKLTETLQPTHPGGVSTLGAFINTAADNLRGQGANIRDTLIKLSQAFSVLGDRSKDTFSTIRNVSILVSALQDSADLLHHLNQNLAGVTSSLADEPGAVGQAVADINAAVGDVQRFVADNRDTLATTSQKLSEVTTTLNQSLDDLKQTLHVAPTGFQNFVNIYQPSQGSLAGVAVINNFANPISFICGSIQAASRLGADQASKLCVQYLAPIIKNRQWNFPPLGENLFIGQTARPNELTYSEDSLRPDYIPPQGGVPPPAPGAPPAGAAASSPAEPQPTDPANGLQGLMVPSGAGS